MAPKTSKLITFISKGKKKRKGIHSKKKFSRSKNAKHYKKLSRGQG